MNNASDFALHKTLNAENWHALRRVGADTNARFLATLGEGRPGLPDPATLESIVLPERPRRPTAPGLRFGDPRTMALLGSIAAFAHVIGGLTNKSLRAQMAAHWRSDYSSAQASYDLRRLRLKGLIERSRRAPTPIASPPTACASAPSSPSSPPVSSSPLSPTSPIWRDPLHQHHAHSPPPGEPTNASSTTQSARPASLPDPKLASSVPNQTVKWV